MSIVMNKESATNIPERERLIVGKETDEDQILSISLRPSKIKEFIGQKDLIDNLLVLHNKFENDIKKEIRFT